MVPERGIKMALFLRCALCVCGGEFLKKYWVKRGTRIWKLLTVISLAGEYPVSGLGLLGEHRHMRRMVSEMCGEVEYRVPGSKEIATCVLLSIVGYGANKSIRVRQEGESVISWLYPGAEEVLRGSTYNYTLPKTVDKVERRHRVAEAVAMYLEAGIPVIPSEREELQLTEKQMYPLMQTSFYTSMYFKTLEEDEVEKTGHSRLVGCTAGPEGCIGIYNVRSSVMRWTLLGEMKGRLNIELIEKNNCPDHVSASSGAILLGQDYEQGMKTLEGLWTSKQDYTEKRGMAMLTNVYDHIYFIPLSRDGIRQLRFFYSEKARESLRYEILKDVVSERKENVDCDTYDGEWYSLLFYDGDIARLDRFIRGVGSRKGRIYCFEHQKDFVRSRVGENIRIGSASMDKISSMIGVPL